MPVELFRSRSRSLSRSRSPISRSPSPRRSRSPPPRRRSRSPVPARRRRSPSYSRSRSRSPPRRRRDDADRLKTITVSHLTKNVTEKHLEEIFGAYGEIQKVDMPLNRRSKLLHTIRLNHIQYLLIFLCHCFHSQCTPRLCRHHIRKCR